MRSRKVLAAIAAPLLVAALAGCGQSAADSYVKVAPATIDQDLRTALAGLKSAHIETKQTAGSASFTMSISVDNQGHCSGTVAQGTQTLTLIGTGNGKIYAKASADFWNKTEGVKASIAAKLADKWLTGLPNGMFTSVCQLSSLVKSFSTQPVAKDQPTVLGKTKINGADAVNLQITVGSNKLVISVAADKPHYPLQMSSGGGQRLSVLSKLDEPLTVTAPSGAQDVNKLAGTK